MARKTPKAEPSGGEDGGAAVRLEPAQAALRDHFLGWQCRLRQLAVRNAGGRPTSGMRPHVRIEGADRPLGRITVLIVKKDPAATTAQFRHMVRRTQDPVERYDDALMTLAAAYFQRPQEFSDELTASFGPGSEMATRLLETGRCVLEFEQYDQRYRLPCRPRDLPREHPAHQATYWHNALFNPAMPGGVRVLGFRPDWARTEADPPVV
ncbi:MAG: hypothetical protein ACE5KF_08485 [Kiloniellaceae bacterium]